MLGEFPGHLRQRLDAGSRTDGLRTGGGTRFNALGDALQNGGDAEQVVGHVEIPVGLEHLRCGQTRALAVQADVFLFRRDTQTGHIEPANTAKRARRNMPCHAVVAEIGQRVTERGEFPVQHRHNARLGRVKHQVVKSKVAVHYADEFGGTGHRRDVLGQPLHQLVHLVRRLRHRACAIGRGRVLLAPAGDLTLEIIAGLAVAGESTLGELDAVQCRNDPVHFLVDGSALLRAHARQALVPQHASGHELHDVEGASNHSLVFAQAVHAWHRHVGAIKAAHDGEFALDGVRRRQQFGHRSGFGAHHVVLRRCAQFVGRIGLAALEGLDAQGPTKSGQMLLEPGSEGGDVKGLACGDRARANEMIKIAHGVVIIR